MAERLALLIWSATPDRPDLVVTPLVHALAGNALDAEVEIHFAGPAVRWLLPDVADAALIGSPPDQRAIGDYLRDCQRAGIPFFACSMARAAWIAPDAALLPAVTPAGATAFVARTLDTTWKTLVF